MLLRAGLARAEWSHRGCAGWRGSARWSGPYLSEVSVAVNVVDLKRSRVITSLPGLVRYLRRRKPDLTHLQWTPQ